MTKTVEDFLKAKLTIMPKGNLKIWLANMLNHSLLLSDKQFYSKCLNKLQNEH